MRPAFDGSDTGYAAAENLDFGSLHRDVGSLAVPDVERTLFVLQAIAMFGTDHVGQPGAREPVCRLRLKTPPVRKVWRRIRRSGIAISRS